MKFKDKVRFREADIFNSVGCNPASSATTPPVAESDKFTKNKFVGEIPFNWEVFVPFRDRSRAAPDAIKYVSFGDPQRNFKLTTTKMRFVFYKSRAATV